MPKYLLELTFLFRFASESLRQRWHGCVMYTQVVAGPMRLTITVASFQTQLSSGHFHLSGSNVLVGFGKNLTSKGDTY